MAMSRLLFALVVVVALLLSSTDGFRGNFRSVMVSPRSATRSYMFGFGKKPEPKPPAPAAEEEETGKKLPDKTTVVRSLLWATTPWIFNSYEDTKNYVDGKKTVKVAVKEEKQSWRNPSTEKRTFGGEDGYGTGAYNMMDDSRAPVTSGSYQDALSKKKKGTMVQEKVEAPKVFGAGLKVAQAVGGVSGGVGVLPDINKYKRPSKTLILYEYEGSPYCKKVRDACSLLDLAVEYRPCPSARYGYSDQLATRTKGDRTVPFFVDPNNAIGALNSSNDADKIVEYLFDYFGPGAENMPANMKKKLGGNAASYTGGAGGKLITNFKKDNIFRKPIDLWGYEGAPAVKPVRETLCGLALAHRFIHCSKGSSNIAKLTQRTGRFEVPYIEDPNSGKKIFGGAEIVQYLTATYTA